MRARRDRTADGVQLRAWNAWIWASLISAKIPTRVLPRVVAHLLWHSSS